jgi:flavorubredoxin
VLSLVKKILAGIGGIIVIFILCIIAMVIMINSANKQKDSDEEILGAKNNAVKSALIVYQPAAFSGITKRIAHKIGEGLSDGGYKVTLNYPGTKLNTDISKYSIVVFGSPTYVGKPLSIVTDYMSRIKDFSSKKVIIYSTGGDKENKSELNEMEKVLNNAKVYEKIKFLDSSKDDNNAYNLGKKLSKQ